MAYQPDPDKPRHECGVAAVYHLPDRPISKLVPIAGDLDSVARLVPRMLLDMQNRGQLAAGMTGYNPKRQALLETHKDLGTVAEAFRMTHRAKFDSIMHRHDGPAAIGHVRYATCGGDNKSFAQPFERSHGRKSKWFAFAFNGQLANFQELKQELLEKDGYHLKRDTDTEILMHSISYEIQNEGPEVDWRGVFARMSSKFDGAYNIVLLTANGDMVVARDPLGIRPLCIAHDGDPTQLSSVPSICRNASIFAAASESVPLSNLGFRNIASLQPGTMAIINREGVRLERFARPRGMAHCFFEWIYFANVASTLDDCSVYLTRTALGRELAAHEQLPLGEDVIVVPVPDTAKAAADAMAFVLGIPSMEGLMRNRYVGRTFIEGTADRQSKVRAKYTPLPEVLSGKRVILVEDSIVRSTTMRALVSEIRERGGAREVHLRVASPPIIAPCYYGIDMSTRKELIAHRFADLPDGLLSEEAQHRLGKELGADSLRYLPVAALARSLGLSEDRLCLACVTGRYPTLMGQTLYQLEGTELNGGNDSTRAYERSGLPASRSC